MTELIGITLLTLAGFLTLTAVFTTLAYLIPARAERARQIIVNRPGRVFIIGLVNLFFFGILALFFSQGGDVGGLLALIILLALSGVAAIGLTGLLLLLRQRFFPPHEDSRHTLLAATTRTAALFVAALLSPGIGWFLLAPILFTMGLGVGLITLIRRRQPRPDD